MASFEDFDALFGSKLAYSSTIRQEIESRRRSLGQLFFDRMLAQLKIKQPSYPPSSAKDLRNLHNQIISAPIAEHHKQSLVYYLLWDTYGESTPTQSFRVASYLPARYWRCVEGFWYLDHFEWSNAVEALTHPAVTPPTFPEEILAALLHHAKDEHSDLPIAYYHSVTPPLSNRDLADSYFSHLAHISVTESFYFLRTRPEQDQEHLLQLLIKESLADFKDNTRADRGVELIELPFTEQEEACFEEYLLNGGGKNYHGSRDAVMARKMATGKFQEALEIGKQLKGRKIDDMSWEPIKTAIAEGLGPRKDLVVRSFQ